MYASKFFNNLTNTHYDKCAYNQDTYESEKPMRYYINDNFCSGCENKDSGYTNVGNFGGVFKGNSENKLGNVDVNSYLVLPTLTRRNELQPSYTFPVAGPYVGRADGFENKVPLDSEYMRGLDTRYKKSCNVLSEVQIDRTQYLPCNPQSQQSVVSDYVVYSGMPTRNGRESMTQKNCPAQSYPTV
jgi:hypothetical protein